MGVKIRLVLYAQSEKKAANLARAAFERIAALEAIFSDYRAESEARQLGDAAYEATVKVSTDFSRVLRLSLELAAASDGAFDPTLGALTQLWRKSRARGIPATDQETENARRRTGWHHLVFSPKRIQLKLKIPGLIFDFGGIAKGDAADEAAKILRAGGCDQFLIDAGGDLLLGAPPPGKEGWTIQLGYKGDLRELSHCGVATSGSSFQYLRVGNQRRSHVLNPTEGLGLNSNQELTCIAKTGALADALATAGSVLGAGEERRALAKRYLAEFIRTAAPR